MEKAEERAIFRPRCFKKKKKKHDLSSLFFKITGFPISFVLSFFPVACIRLKPDSIVSSLPRTYSCIILFAHLLFLATQVSRTTRSFIDCIVTHDGKRIFFLSPNPQHINHHFSFNPFLVRRTGRTHSRLACRHLSTFGLPGDLEEAQAFCRLSAGWIHGSFVRSFESIVNSR